MDLCVRMCVTLAPAPALLAFGGLLRYVPCKHVLGVMANRRSLANGVPLSLQGGQALTVKNIRPISRSRSAAAATTEGETATLRGRGPPTRTILSGPRLNAWQGQSRRSCPYRHVYGGAVCQHYSTYSYLEARAKRLSRLVQNP